MIIENSKNQDGSNESEEQLDLNPVGRWALVRYFLKLGALGFGGPIALAGYMQRDLIPAAG